MKLIFLLSVFISFNCLSQSTGYILQMADGSVRLPNGSVTNAMLATPGVPATTLIDSMNAVQQRLNGKQAAGSYATLTGAEVLNNKIFGAFNVGVDAGANDSYSINMATSPGSYTTGMIVIFKANTQNTTGCSINVNGLGVKNIVKRVNTTPATGDILAAMWCLLVYDGTNFVLLNPVVN